jgi:hypothetical protein
MPITRVLGVEATRLMLDGEPFPYTGLSFFNALYNPAFNRSAEERRRWMHAFRGNGVNALRVWCQWDFDPPRTFADVAPGNSMYTGAGEIREEHFRTLVQLISAADELGMVLEVTFFSHEKEPILPPEALERGARRLAERLIPYRNVIRQIWNEDSTEWRRLFQAITEVDPDALVTSSPGVANVLGDDEQNRAYHLLTPHTVRRSPDSSFWEVAPRQIASLIERFDKPVIDDEPARNGPMKFGGIEGGTRPEWHIEQIRRVRAAGGYPTYHHDMFQYGYGAPTTPPTGVPDPDFNAFHRRVFDFLRETNAPG